MTPRKGSKIIVCMTKDVEVNEPNIAVHVDVFSLQPL